MTKKRVVWIDTIKGWAILCVILGHISLGENPLCIWIYSFHMPLWFVLSGVLFFLSEDKHEQSASRFLKRKAVSLLYPYFTFSVICLLYDVIKNGISENTCRLFTDTVSFLGIGTLWFLPVMFFSVVLFYSLHSLPLSDFPIFGLLLLLIFLGDRFIGFESYYVLQRILIAASFLFIGYFYEMLMDAVRLEKTYCCLLGIVLLACSTVLSQTNGYVDLHYGIMNNIFLYYPLAVLGCCGLCILGSSLVLPNWIEAPLIFLGKNSLTIFATHANLPYIYYAGLMFLSVMPGFSNNYINAVFILFIVVLFEIVTIALVNRFGKFLFHPKYLKRPEKNI